MMAKGKKKRRHKSQSTKAACQRAHTRKRLRERFGVFGNRKLLDSFVERIQIRDRVIFIDKQSNRVSRWYIFHEQYKIAVVYDSIRKVITTVLTEEQIEAGKPNEKLY